MTAYDATQDADWQPIEQRRNFSQDIPQGKGKRQTLRRWNTATASRQWHRETIHSETYFSGLALYSTMYDRWFVHHYHQWERFNTITPISRSHARLLTHATRPDLVEPIFGPTPEAGAGRRPRKPAKRRL
jgi:hypothetical protein